MTRRTVFCFLGVCAALAATVGFSYVLRTSNQLGLQKRRPAALIAAPVKYKRAPWAEHTQFGEACEDSERQIVASLRAQGLHVTEAWLAEARCSVWVFYDPTDPGATGVSELMLDRVFFSNELSGRAIAAEDRSDLIFFEDIVFDPGSKLGRRGWYERR